MTLTKYFLQKMKFCQTWKKEVMTLPDLLADSCINYKRYKKLIRRADYKEVMTTIINDCKRVNRDFIRYVHPNRRIIFAHPCKFEIAPVKTDLVKFAQLNNICLRKICKKADKIVKDLPYPQFFTKWLSECKTEHNWDFMDGKELTLLEMKTRSIENNGEVPKLECPICFEEKKR